MSDNEDSKVVSAVFGGRPSTKDVPEDHKFVALIKEAIAMAAAEGETPTQLVYIMLNEDCVGTVGYHSSPTSGASNPRALLSLSMTMIAGLVNE